MSLRLCIGTGEENDIICAYLLCDSPCSLAGLTVDLLYDTDKLEFTSAYKSSGAEKLNFTCSLEDNGRIRVLFDGAQNETVDGKMAVFGFKRKMQNGTVQPEDFDVDLPYGENAFLILQNGVQSIPVRVFLAADEEDREDQNNASKNLNYVGYQTGKGRRVRLVGAVSDGAFQAGFDLRLVDMSGGSVNDCTLYSDALKYNICGSDLRARDYDGEYFFCCELPLPTRGVYAVYFMPVCRYASDTVVGEEFLIIIKDGCVILHEPTRKK